MEVGQRELASISQNIQQAMQRKGWTQKKLASETGLNARTIMKIFNGDATIQIQNIFLVAKCIDIPFATLAYQEIPEGNELTGITEIDQPTIAAMEMEANASKKYYAADYVCMSRAYDRSPNLQGDLFNVDGAEDKYGRKRLGMSFETECRLNKAHAEDLHTIYFRGYVLGIWIISPNMLHVIMRNTRVNDCGNSWEHDNSTTLCILMLSNTIKEITAGSPYRIISKQWELQKESHIRRMEQKKN